MADARPFSRVAIPDTSLRARVGKALTAALRSFRDDGRGAEALTNVRTPAKPFEAQGRSATANYAGYIRSRETNPMLLGSRRWETYDDMVWNVPIVSASMRYYQNLIARPSWEFDPVDDTDEAKRYAEMTDKALRGYLATPWHQVIRKAATYRPYGFSCQEWKAERQEDGMIAITDIQNRLQRTVTKWDSDEHGVVRGIVQTSPHDGNEYYVSRRKMIYLVDNSFDDSPEGLGLLRHAVVPCQALLRLVKLEGWGYEMDLRGMPVVRAPLALIDKLVAEGKMTPEKAAEILDPLMEIAQQHVKTPELAVFLDSQPFYGQGENGVPSNVRQFDFEVLQGDTSKNAETAIGEAIRRYEWAIARIFGTDTMLLGSDGKGTYALSDDKTKNLLMVIDGVLLDIANQVRDDFLRPIFLMNGWPDKYLPRPVTDAITYRDITTITAALVDLAKAGSPLPPDSRAPAVIHRALGLPKPPEINRAAEALVGAEEAAADATRAKASDRQKKSSAAQGDQQGSPGITRD